MTKISKNLDKVGQIYVHFNFLGAFLKKKRSHCFWNCSGYFILFYFLKKQKIIYLKKKQLANNRAIIIFLLIIGSVGPVDQQINLVSPERYRALAFKGRSLEM